MEDLSYYATVISIIMLHIAFYWLYRVDRLDQQRLNLKLMAKHRRLAVLLVLRGCKLQQRLASQLSDKLKSLGFVPYAIESNQEEQVSKVVYHDSNGDEDDESNIIRIDTRSEEHFQKAVEFIDIQLLKSRGLTLHACIVISARVCDNKQPFGEPVSKERDHLGHDDGSCCCCCRGRGRAMPPISLSLLLNALDRNSGGGVRLIQVQTDNEYHYGLCECLQQQQEGYESGGGGECCCLVEAADSRVENNLYNVEIRPPPPPPRQGANESGSTVTTTPTAITGALGVGQKSSPLPNQLMNDMINRLLCRPLALPVRLLKHLMESKYSRRELLFGSTSGCSQLTDPSSDKSRLVEEAILAITDLVVTEKPRSRMTVIS